MKKNYLSFSALLMAGVMLISGCASTTLIQSSPGNAKVYINGEPVGETPYKYTDDKIAFSCTEIYIEKEGYEPLATVLTRDEEIDAGPVVGGFLVCPVFLLWSFKYKPTHTYELFPVGDTVNDYVSNESGAMDNQKADQLRQLKLLLDDGVLTPEEYEREKTKILNE